MAAPDIILSNGQVLVMSGLGSQLGVVPFGNKSFLQFGTVAKINDLCDSVAVDDPVMYDSSKGQTLLYGSTIYILIDEQHISGTEIPIP